MSTFLPLCELGLEGQRVTAPRTPVWLCLRPRAWPSALQCWSQRGFGFPHLSLWGSLMEVSGLVAKTTRTGPGHPG